MARSTLGAQFVLCWLLCIIHERAISRLDNARCALSRLVNALSQTCESAFTEKGCTLHRLKGAWHRAVIYGNTLVHL